MVEFIEFPKMPRLSREAIVTEKIDGTNACIFIGENGEFLTGSRSRWITPADDNFGFSAWAHANREELMQLGTGRHFGEWWGRGIQRGYGLPDRCFSLFNALRWVPYGVEPMQIPTGDPRVVKMQQQAPKICKVVPILARGVFDSALVEQAMERLRTEGSAAAPGFQRPEGVVVYHVAGSIGFKKTLDRDGLPKGAVL